MKRCNIVLSQREIDEMDTMTKATGASRSELTRRAINQSFKRFIKDGIAKYVNGFHQSPKAGAEVGE